MARASRVLAVLPLLLLAAGCQDYNFNPVGHCLIQPGSERVTLSSISTADVLFVVDDSGSMAGEQEKLAQNFAAFIQNLDQTNTSRRGAGLEPIDFHVAVTTTSLFYNAPVSGVTCRNDCPGAAGQQVCCEAPSGAPTGPMKGPRACTSDAACGGIAGATCKTTCTGLLGEGYCCGADNVAPAVDPIGCSALGTACGRLETHYRFDGRCAPGLASDGQYYPHGAFVGLGDSPRVLHFDKELYPATDGTGQPIRDAALPPCSDGSKVCNRQGFTAAQLKDWFANNRTGTWQGNVIAGTCGSGQEQALQAGRLAVERALTGGQVDRRDASGSVVASTPASWLHDNSKLVTVFVGDEDDCSSPQDPSGGVVLSGGPGSDSCVADASSPTPKQYAVSQIVDYLTGLGRPVGAGFIVSTSQSVCQDASCAPGICCDYACTGSTLTCTNSVCGGQAPGSRLLLASQELRAKGADVVAGSICDPNFAQILDRIAEIVKPPSGLLLPTDPAGSDIVLLRIANQKGDTRKTCRGPAPSAMTAAEAGAAGYDWWFTATRDQITADQRKPTAATRNIYINHDTRNCEANPGETYSADYLGRLPAGGCQTRTDCYAALGGKPNGDTDAWTCYAGESGNPAAPFTQPTPTAPGTCICGDLGAGSF
ncbi:hypothetical protein [Anaeromyxobacter sp. PSR-1]|uniref:hypothetical protein n=1 Tax=Anaeromyxobacter sp. PSR-1 TaxID=1300915 RepID=UPI0005E90E5E|nr:hypothetical protein [Anaeromyxobacter sp. PSR-1]GAO01245.1 hypothetical protein PSR1_00098 [Anaeromyxobacter sp. PSR-1]